MDAVTLFCRQRDTSQPKRCYCRRCRRHATCACLMRRPRPPQNAILNIHILHMNLPYQERFGLRWRSAPPAMVNQRRDAVPIPVHKTAIRRDSHQPYEARDTRTAEPTRARAAAMLAAEAHGGYSGMSHLSRCCAARCARQRRRVRCLGASSLYGSVFDSATHAARLPLFCAIFRYAARPDISLTAIA